MKHATMHQEAPYSVVDLFSGCGGLTLGMKNAGFQVIAAVDNDPLAIQTYRSNFSSDALILEKDLWTFSPEELSTLIPEQEVDVIVGGPPCQGFSVARKVDGSNHGNRFVEDKRRFLFRRFLYYVEHFSPKMFIIENVRGIRTAHKGKIFEEIMSGGEKIGYQIHESVLRSWQFGVPQKRIRQVFIGVRGDLPDFSIDAWIQPTHADIGAECTSPLEAPVTLWEAIGDLPAVKAGQENNMYDYDLRKKHQAAYGNRYLGNVLELEKTENLTAHSARAHSARDLHDFAVLKEGESSAQALARGAKMRFPYNRHVFKDRYTRQHRARLSSTIVAHLSKDGLMFIHPQQQRSFTPREAARLQGFPDWFVFPVARTHQYRLIGNAVPPLLGQAVGAAVKKYLTLSNIPMSRAAGE